jgi:RNA polymerase sigma factor (sigma-70 family)
MANGSAGADTLNQLNTLFRFGVVGDLSDGQLVQRFLTARDGADQAAFTALVARHGPMVLGVCREVLGNAHDAQDAFQATFLVLARNAGSVRKADSVSSWLHGVALRVALRAKAGEARRRMYERRSAERKSAELGRQEGSREWWPELHEEIGRLPARYREPVVLYYLEGLTTEEAALRVGCPHGTILSRLSRARERLRRQLDRRGFALSAALLTTGQRARATAALPVKVLETTVQAAFAFAGRKAREAALASIMATTLAREVLYTMTISKLKILGATALACALAWGGVQAFGQLARASGSQKPGGAAPHAAERQAAVVRSVEKLQSALDESARRNSEMGKLLQDIRAELDALRASQQPSVAKGAAGRLAEAIETDSAQAVSRLADALKRHPPRLSQDRGWEYQVYMLDLVEGGTTLIADEALPDHFCSGMPRWSHDGTRIVFDVSGSQSNPDLWPRARLMAIEVRDGLPTFTDLGDGNNPTFSPDDQRIAFLLHAGNEAGAGGGVWMMRADGSRRHRVGDFGAPFWSPDGREFLINGYSLPTVSTVIDLETKDGGVVEVPGHQIFSWPSWAGPGTLVSALATKERYEGGFIALLDVRKPAQAKIIEVLWKRSDDLNVIPRWPVYRPDTRQCFFVGEEPKKRAIYMVERGESRPARRLEVVEYPRERQQLAGLSFSPDGRYLLFKANRPERE